MRQGSTITCGTVAGTPGPTEALQVEVEAVPKPSDALNVDFVGSDATHSARVLGDAPVVIYHAYLATPE